MFAGPPPNICYANESSLRMLGTIKLQVPFRHKKVVLKFIVRDTLAAPAIIGADFCDQYVNTIRFTHKLVELGSGNYIPIVLKPRGLIKAQIPLPDGLTYSKGNPRLSFIVRVAEKLTLPAQSQTWVLVATLRSGTVAPQP